jgi:hypothetical protein
MDVSLVDSMEEYLTGAPQASGLNDLIISAHGFIQGVRRAGDERSHTHRTIHHLTLRTVGSVAGVGVKDDLALDTAGAHDALLKALYQDMGAVDWPVFRHDDVGIDMSIASGTNGA